MLCRSGPASFSKFTLCQMSSSLNCPLVKLEPISLSPGASSFPPQGLHTRGSFCLDSLQPSLPQPLLLTDSYSSSQFQLGWLFLQETLLPPFNLMHKRELTCAGQGTSLLPQHLLLPSPQHLLYTRIRYKVHDNRHHTFIMHCCSLTIWHITDDQ